MNKESLIKAKDIILEALARSGINPIDNAEISLNLYRFLDEKEYEQNIKVLRMKNDSRRN